MIATINQSQIETTYLEVKPPRLFNSSEKKILRDRFAEDQITLTIKQSGFYHNVAYVFTFTGEPLHNSEELIRRVEWIIELF